MLKHILITLAITTFLTIPIGMFIGQYFDFNSSSGLVSPLVQQIDKEKEKHLQKYAIENLSDFPLQTSTITLGELIEETPEYQQYTFSFSPLGKKMTGSLTIPQSVISKEIEPKVIMMIRGFVPKEIYKTGLGTQNAANVFAQNGYITIAPDFFGYGESDPEPEDTWQARFEKPVIVLELMKSIEEIGVPIGEGSSSVPVDLNFKQSDSKILNIEKEGNQSTEGRSRQGRDNQLTNVAFWAHSNGGQIALTAAQALERPIPITLWAPVTAPFPYSIAYFSDELEDEGKSQRKWIALFEEDYDVFDFSLTQHLDKLHGPLQIHQGLADEAAPYLWNDEFVEKIESENKKRSKVLEELTYSTATESAEAYEPPDQSNLQPIGIDYFRYPTTDHNMKPNWDSVVQQDLVFFRNKIESQ